MLLIDDMHLNNNIIFCVNDFNHVLGIHLIELGRESGLSPPVKSVQVRYMP